MIERRSVMDDIFGRPGKRCAMCGRWLEVFQFNKSKTSKDGLQSYCRTCQQIYKKRHPTKEYKNKKQDKYSLELW